MSDYSWLVTAAAAALSLAGADVFLKLSSTRISQSLGTMIYAVFTLVVPAVMLALERRRGVPLRYSEAGIFYAVLMGIAYSLVVVFMMLTFARRVNLSVGAPAIRMAGIVTASVLGILLFREPVSLRYLGGFALALTGIYLMVSR
jgi:drug/metabolite transporter (DMT)-like permease